MNIGNSDVRPEDSLGMQIGGERKRNGEQRKKKRKKNGKKKYGRKKKSVSPWFNPSLYLSKTAAPTQSPVDRPYERYYKEGE